MEKKFAQWWIGQLWVSQVVLVVKNAPANAGDIRGTVSIPGLGRSPGEGKGYPLQTSGLGEFHGLYIVHGVAKSRTQLSDFHFHVHFLGFPGGASGKERTCQCRRHKRCRFDPWVGKISWRSAWQPTPVFLSGESPWIEEPSELQSIESERIGYD